VNDLNSNGFINCFSDGRNVVIESNQSIKWELYSLQGALIQRGNAGRGYNRFTPELPFGTYLLVFETTQGSQIQKIVLGN
jgi:hypothetical protein